MKTRMTTMMRPIVRKMRRRRTTSQDAGSASPTGMAPKFSRNFSARSANSDARIDARIVNARAAVATKRIARAIAMMTTDL